MRITKFLLDAVSATGFLPTGPAADEPDTSAGEAPLDVWPFSMVPWARDGEHPVPALPQLSATNEHVASGPAPA